MEEGIFSKLYISYEGEWLNGLRDGFGIHV